jgi:xylose isomerase
LRRQSIDAADLLHAHIAGLDTLARALLIAEALVTDARLDQTITERYAGWSAPLGQDILSGTADLRSLDRWAQTAPAPAPVSGRQERLEAIVADAAWRAGGQP